ncbi:MAG: PD40 domain-containing protein [Acidobacteria bacterium]|nr:PD40 domain-containing protein [Acidobacteriota bacterium]
MGEAHRVRDKIAIAEALEAADVRMEMEEALTAPATALPAAAGRRERCAGRRPAQSFILSTLVVGCISVILGCNTNLASPSETASASGARSVLTLPPNEPLVVRSSPTFALSPDGAHLVYAAGRGGSRQLYRRAMDSLEGQPIPGTEGASTPFFSPDGHWVGFYAGGQMKKVSLGGGAPLTLCDAPSPFGASWGTNGTIVFAPTNISGLWQVSAAGGTPQPLTRLETGESSHRWPELLPGGKMVLFTVFGPGLDAPQIAMHPLEGGERERRVLIEGGTYPRYAPTGHLVYAQAGTSGTLLAAPFDLARLEVTDAPVPIVEGVMQSNSGAAQYSFSSFGSLVYIPGGDPASERRLVWVDRQGGAEQPLAAPPRRYVNLQLSPDDQRLAVQIESPNPDVWIYDIPRETLTRLTFAGGGFPLWTPDGKRVTFPSSRAGVPNLFWKLADGSGAAEQLTTREHPNDHSFSWSPDGRVLAFTEVHPTTGWDIWVLPLEGDRRPRPFLQTPFREAAPRFSPDGRWLAYVSDESGRPEIYAQPFPGPGKKWQISTAGGIEPVWARNGKELFYWNSGQMMAVDITSEPTFSAGSPRLLFEGPYVSATSTWRPKYDVTSDGRRFVMIQRGLQELGVMELNVVLNWFEELKRKAPAQ